MKYHYKIALVAIASALAACSKGSSSNSSTYTAKPFGDNTTGAKFVTDLSHCGTGPSATGLEGTWESDMVIPAGDSQLSIQAQFEFAGGVATLTNTCSIAGRSLQVVAHSNYMKSGDSVRFLSEDNEHQEINEPNFNLNCDINLKPMTIHFATNGSCLTFTKEGESQSFTLIPVGARATQPSWPQPQPAWPQPPVHQTPPVAQPVVPQPQVPPANGDFPPPVNTQPGQMPPAASGQYACMTDNRSTNQVFIGYAASQFAASVLAKQSCAGGTDNYYCNEPTLCGQLEYAQDAWFCEVDNRSTKLVYTGTGRSQGEATYAARKSCVASDSTNAYYCNKEEKVACVHQH